jgi:hypothetical protein
MDATQRSCRQQRGGRERGGEVDASARTHLVLFQVTSKRTLQCVQVTDAPAAIVRSSVCSSFRPSENVRVTTLARTGIDPMAQKLKANLIHGSKRGCPTGCRTEGPDGVVPTVDMMNACQIYSSKSWCRIGARWAPRQGARGGLDGVLDGVPDGAKRSARCGQTRAMSLATSFLNAMSPV